ncbi:MAG: ShlB/FhaC/HecB family hemolysin secretion/activation protein [Candidatus Ratteibacteria bacterium]
MTAQIKLLGFLILSLFVTTGLFAASDKVYTGLTEQEQLQTTPLSEMVQPARPELKLEATQKIRVEKFLISGNKHVSTDELLYSIEKYKGKELSVAQLLDLADVLTRKYWEKGYITSFAYIPVQKMERGILEIEVVEGRPGKIVVKDNRYYTTRFIEGYFDFLTEENVLSNRSLERGLLLLNEFPKLNVNATLTKGDEPGTTDIVINTKEERYPISFSLLYNNFASRYTGYNRFGVMVDWGNLTKRGDTLSLATVVNPEDFAQMHYWKLGYAVPIGTSGANLSLHYTSMKHEVGKELSILGIEGKSELFGFDVTYPIVRARDRNYIASVGFKKKLYENFLFEKLYLSSKDDYSVLEAGIKGDRFFKGNNHTFFTAQTTVGLGSFWGMSRSRYTSSSRPGLPSGHFAKFNLGLINVTPIGKCQFLTKGSGQYTFGNLVAAEQFVIGGPDTVRGYPSGEFLADNGFAFTTELRTPLLPGDRLLNKYVNWAIFADYGKTFYNDTLPGDEEGDLFGAGVGLRIQPSNYFNMRVDLGYPLSSTASDRKDWRCWVNATLEF